MGLQIASLDWIWRDCFTGEKLCESLFLCISQLLLLYFQPLWIPCLILRCIGIWFCIRLEMLCFYARLDLFYLGCLWFIFICYCCIFSMHLFTGLRWPGDDESRRPTYAVSLSLALAYLPDHSCWNVVMLYWEYYFNFKEFEWEWMLSIDYLQLYYFMHLLIKSLVLSYCVYCMFNWCPVYAY